MDKKYAAQEAIEHSMMGNLGLKLIEEREGFVRASMPVNDNTSQPFGVLCGAPLWHLRKSSPDTVLI